MMQENSNQISDNSFYYKHKSLISVENQDVCRKQSFMLLKIEKYLDITSTAPYRDLMGFPKTGFMLVFFWRDDIYSLCFVENSIRMLEIYTQRTYFLFLLLFLCKNVQKKCKEKKIVTSDFTSQMTSSICYVYHYVNFS